MQNLMNKDPSEVFHAHVGRFELGKQEIGVYLRNSKQHLEVPEPPLVSLPGVLKGSSPLPFAVVFVHSVKAGLEG